MSDDQWYPQPGEGVMSWVTRVSAETNRRLEEKDGARRAVESGRVPTLLVRADYLETVLYLSRDALVTEEQRYQWETLKRATHCAYEEAERSDD
jgi:pimeloyl-ACP methyl ester carboxylesterase